MTPRRSWFLPVSTDVFGYGTGSVQGLVIDSADHRATHVLLQEGHFWGRQQLAIPIEAISREDDGIRVKYTKQQVQDLPEVDLSSSP